MIRGVIFDADGVLLDSMAIWEEAGERYLRKQGREPEPRLGRTLFAMTVQEAAQYLKETYAISLGIQEIAAGILETVNDFYLYEVQLKPGVSEFLEALDRKGIQAAVATSSEKSQIEQAFQRLGIRKYFQGIATCTEAGAGKTEPAVYEMARNMLGTEVKETAVMEDSLYALLTAKRAGYPTVGIYDPFSEEDQEELKRQADLYLPDLRNEKRFWDCLL